MAHQLGGRVRITGQASAAVADVSCWTPEMTDLFMYEFPLGRLSVESNPSSLSGFEIRVSVVEVDVCQNIVAIVFIAVLMALVAIMLRQVNAEDSYFSQTGEWLRGVMALRRVLPSNFTEEAPPPL